MAAAEPRDGWSWKHIVLQVAYDPRSQSDVTVEALRQRAQGVMAAMRACWRNGLGQKGAGLRFAVEIAGSGFVHLHAIYWGPYIAKEWLETTAKDAFPAIGKAWIEQIAEDRSDQVRAVLEVAKYTTKAPSPLSEQWFEEAREVLHPVLAARWELATSQIQLTCQLGIMRDRSKKKGLDEVQEQDREEYVEETDKDLACEQCGVVGEWRWVSWTTSSWVRYCHQGGVRAFAGSKWRASRGAGPVSDAA